MGAGWYAPSYHPPDMDRLTVEEMTGIMYVSEYVIPELQRLGVTDEQIKKIMIDTPKRALTFTAPQPAATFSTAQR